ncbi:YdeI/OmpD-associated family protein [Tessaracoccus sp. G1721]
MIELRTTIVAFGPAGAIELTDEESAAVSPSKTPPVVVTIGDASARLRITRMGGAACIGLSRAARAALGVEIGDEVDVTIAADEAERTVDVPHQLADALAADAALQRAWDALSYTRRKELARGIAEAKQEATRERRLAKALEELGNLS